MRNETIIIPSLNPDHRLLYLIELLKEYGFYRIIIVNDGSPEEYHDIFKTAGELGCTIIEHDTNLGKGAAIRTGIKTHVKMYGSSYGVITMDADGQHLPSDTAKISNAMAMYPDSLVLGTRDFGEKNVPFKSRNGNRITSFFFYLSTGIKCPDTQTGLRGIPSSLLQLAAEEEGSRYEYEMRFLEDAVKIAPVRYIPIETIYEDGNSGSHFRAVRDSIRIYMRALRFAASSLIGAAVDIAVFYVLTKLAGTSAALTITLATVIARILSGTVNFTLNKYWCFKSRSKTAGELIRYSILFVSLMLMSATLVTAASSFIPVIAAKLIVDTTLFFVSFFIQKRFIFANQRKENVIMKKKKPVWALTYGLLLTGYAVFVLLDAFVIPHDIVKLDTAASTTDSLQNESATDISENRSGKPKQRPGSDTEKHSGHRRKGAGDAGQVEAAERDKSSEIKLPDTTEEKSTDTKDSSSGKVSETENGWLYESDDATIEITKKYINNTWVYIADVQLNDSSLLKSGLAENTLGRNITAKTSEIASEVGAILAINGDYYGFRDTGYVMRNGYLYRTTSSGDDSEDLVVYADGTMEIITEGSQTAEELSEKGAVQIYSFGPGLVEEGKVAVDKDAEVGQSMESNPRTAIGYYSPTHYCFVVSDGRTSESEGLSLYELAQVMSDLGVESAYNLDGGGSTTMYFNGEIINNPTTNGNKISERSVSDIIYIERK